MAYLAKKSRKRGSAHKKSRYAKRRMTGGVQTGEWENMHDGTYKYTICKDGCCKWQFYSYAGKNDAPKNIDALTIDKGESEPEHCVIRK